VDPASTLVRAEPLPPTVETGLAAPMIDAFYNTLLATMKDGPTLGFNGRVARLTPAITQAFDLPAMTRIAAGAQWPTLSPNDQHRLIDAFSRFSVASYAANFDSYDDERFEVLREVPAPGSGGGVIVETRLLPKKGDPVQLNYLMRRGKDGLQIIDVFVNGTISEMATRRSEFSSVLNRGGAQALYDVLETKIKTLAARK
jgi:phospholipid transport system substrate-binding protein